MRQPTSRRSAFGLLMGLIGICLILFQNCAPFGQVTSQTSKQFSLNSEKPLEPHPVFGGSGGPNLVPSTDRQDPDCLNSTTNYHACIFLKNPVFANNSPMTTIHPNVDLRSMQTYGIRLTGLLNSGHLENKTISVRSARNNIIDTMQPFPFFAATTESHGLAQMLHIYYWLNRTVEYLGFRVGELPARDKLVKVFVDDSVSGYARNTNSIHLKESLNGSRQGWSAELAIYFFGIANFFHANPNAFANVDRTKHRLCNLAAAGCCQTQRGCVRGIESAAGDYFVGVMFPDSAIVGETVENRLGGLRHCGLNHDLIGNKSLRAADAFNLCTQNPGDIYAMGIFYASIWFDIRSSLPAKQQADIDKLFLLHLSRIEPQDDFVSALGKASALDQTHFSGQYTTNFQNQILARGL